MNRPLLLIIVVLLGGLGLSSLFTVQETEYAIRFQLGRIVKADYEPGLHFKLPFVNNIRKFDNRILTLDTPAEPMLTSEQKFVEVDSFVKWRIANVSRFYTATGGNESRALNRLNGIIEDRLRNQIDRPGHRSDVDRERAAPPAAGTGRRPASPRPTAVRRAPRQFRNWCP